MIEEGAAQAAIARRYFRTLSLMGYVAVDFNHRLIRLDLHKVLWRYEAFYPRPKILPFSKRPSETPLKNITVEGGQTRDSKRARPNVLLTA